MGRWLAALILLWTVPAAGESTRPLVGHAMALLAVFEEAGVLPPETSPDANALIHALIQTQAALTKTTDPATRKWFGEALRRGSRAGIELRPEDGLTSRSLEAILAYAHTHPPADRSDVLAGLRAFNVTPSDLDRLGQVYENARKWFQQGGRDIHQAYEAQRRSMPFR